MDQKRLTPRQLQERELIVRRLAAAGWNGDNAINRLFEKGKSFRAQAEMEYANESLKLTVTYFAHEEQPLFFGFYERREEDEEPILTALQPPRGLDLVFEIEGCLEALLEAIVAVQDEIALDDYKDAVRQLLEACPRAYVWREGEEGDEIIPLRE
jgi:hypothetical protein